MSRFEGTGKVFKVRIDVALPAEVLDRIERAIQKSVLTELTDTDIASGYSVVMRAPADGVGGAGAGAEGPVATGRGEGRGIPPLPGSEATDGIWIREEQERGPL